MYGWSHQKKSKDELLAERTACEVAKQDAHNRIIEINKTLKKIENLIAEADEILGPEKPLVTLTGSADSGILVKNQDHGWSTIPTDSEITQAINER